MNEKYRSIRPRLARTLLACTLLAAAPAAFAGGQLGLNHVWSRLADVYGEPGSVESAEFSPDSRLIVTGTKFDFTLDLWRTADGELLWERTLPDEIERAAFTRDGRQVVSGSEDFVMRVFAVDGGELAFEYRHDNGIDSLAASHDGRYMVSGQEGVDGVGLARVFDVRDWSLVETLEHRGTVNELDFTHDDRFMAATGSQNTRIWRVSDWSLVHEFRLDEQPMLPGIRLGYINCKFSPDGQILAIGGTHGFVYLFDVETGKLLRRFNKTGQKTETVTWTADGRYLLVAGHGTTIDFYRTAQLLDEAIENDAIPWALRVPVTDALEYMDFNQAGTLFTTAHQDGTVQLWTFMSDDPTINTVRHEAIREEQDRKAEAQYRE